MDYYEQQIEKLKKENLELKSENRLKSEFITNISHELKTPLNSVIGFSSILSKNKKNNLDDKQLKYVNTINSNGVKLLKILEYVINLNKIELAKSELHIKTFDLNYIIKEVIELLSTQVDEKAMQLNYSCLCENLNCSSDISKLQFILIHLITNAIKHSKMSVGIIDIALECDDEYFKISIKDNANGISEDIKDIFNNYDKKSNEKQYESLGLGLSVAKNTIQLLQGYIELKSKIDFGSTFIINLPIKGR